MKRIFYILLTAVMLPLCAEGQHYIGVRGGYGLGFGRFTPPREMKTVWGLWSGGVAWKYYGHDKYFGGFGAEVEFLQRGYEYLVHNDDKEFSYRRKLNTINIPIIWQPHVNLLSNRLRIFLNAGVFVAYNINSWEEDVMRGEGVIYRKPYQMRLVRDNPLNYGLQFGLGFNVMMGKLELAVEGRYYFSYGDVLRTLGKYQLNRFLRTPIDNFNMSIGIFYRIDKRPDRPVMSARAMRRYEKRAAKVAKMAKEAKKSEKKPNSDGNNTSTEGS